MSLRRPAGQIRLLQRLLAEGGPFRQVACTAEQTEGVASSAIGTLAIVEYAMAHDRVEDAPTLLHRNRMQ